MKIEQDKPLDNFSTMACPSVAEYFVAPGNIAEVKEAIQWAKKNDTAIHLLGGGSNLILSSKISGLVLSPKVLGVEVVSQDDQSTSIRLGAGENWHQSVEYCVGLGLSGIENLALIPGTCGAAPIQNIGAYGVEICEVFESLRAVNLETLEVETFSKDECVFSYRESVFKSRLKNAYVICDITLALQREFVPKIAYPALAKSLEGQSQITAKDVMEAVVEIRKSKLPDPDRIPNSGSFFKNPIVQISHYQNLINTFSDIPRYFVDEGHVKIPAAWLIENAGWKGKDVGGVRIHSEHALVLTNPNKCRSNEVFDAANKIISSVFERFAIELEVEPQTL